MAIQIAPYKVGLFAASAALASIAGLFYGMLFQRHPGPEQFSVPAVAVLPGDAGAGRGRGAARALVGGSFLAVGQPLVNLFDIRLFL